MPISNDPAHGYNQTFRWGEKGDCDCSSAVIQACQNAGIPVKIGGANTAYAIKQYQNAREKVNPGICGSVDGIAGPKALQDMIAL